MKVAKICVRGVWSSCRPDAMLILILLANLGGESRLIERGEAQVGGAKEGPKSSKLDKI